MTVLLTRPYAGSPAAAVVSLTTELEAALIAQNLATASTRASTTTGTQVLNALQGTCAAAAAATNVVVTNALVDVNSHVTAVIAQAAADGTALRVERVVCSAGFFTIYLTAGATATTLIDWVVDIQSGMSQRL